MGLSVSIACTGTHCSLRLLARDRTAWGAVLTSTATGTAECVAIDGVLIAAYGAMVAPTIAAVAQRNAMSGPLATIMITATAKLHVA
jgi:hypothetical protein